ncbi:MAG TPA: hypothetical protein VM240_04375 [Verrucomicrobiae bacterium]|nr:hypothetical protein [Verrucomicrobiae bacterium]
MKTHITHLFVLLAVLCAPVAQADSAPADAAAAATVAPTIVAPKAGQVHPSGSGDITFNVDSTKALKGHPSAGCCEVEFQSKNASGKWVANDPVTVEYPRMKDGDYLRSSSEFKASADWRMRVRTVQYKKEFPWSDWVEFKVIQ